MRRDLTVKVRLAGSELVRLDELRPAGGRLRKQITALRRQLSREIPKKADRNLLVATWNIREFGGLTEKWRSTSEDTPKRDLHSLACITEMVKRFDIVAIQEAQKKLIALRHLLAVPQG